MHFCAFQGRKSQLVVMFLVIFMQRFPKLMGASIEHIEPPPLAMGLLFTTSRCVCATHYSVSTKALKGQRLDPRCRKSTSENLLKNSCVLERGILDYKQATTRVLHSLASTSANRDQSTTELNKTSTVNSIPLSYHRLSNVKQLKLVHKLFTIN